jgi:hypothetical protein
MNEIVTLAENLIPLLCELRHTTEHDRRIAEPIVQAIRASDLCRMFLDTGAPPHYTPDEWLRFLETLAGAEASASWLIWKNALPCFWSRFLDDAGRERVFGDSGRVFAGSTRPTGQAVITAGGGPAEWPLVSRVWLRTGRLCTSHEPVARRRGAAHACAWPARPPRAFRAQGQLRHPRHLACRGLTWLRESRCRRGRRVRVG